MLPATEAAPATLSRESERDATGSLDKFKFAIAPPLTEKGARDAQVGLTEVRPLFFPNSLYFF
jgi:hypothetical protein